MHETELKDIIKECEGGKPEAFRAIVSAYQTLVYGSDNFIGGVGLVA